MLKVSIIIENSVIYIKVGNRKGVPISLEDLKQLISKTFSERNQLLKKILKDIPDDKISKIEKDDLIRAASTDRAISLELLNAVVGDKVVKIIRNDESFELICDTNDESARGAYYDSVPEILNELRNTYGYTSDEISKVRDLIKYLEK